MAYMDYVKVLTNISCKKQNVIISYGCFFNFVKKTWSFIALPNLAILLYRDVTKKDPTKNDKEERIR